MLARLRIALAFATLGVIAALSAPHTYAQEQATYLFDLPEQPLAESLRAIARQTGANVLFESKDLKDIKAPAVRAQLTTAAAIERVLAGTPLRAQRTTPTTVIVQPADEKKAQGLRLARNEAAVAAAGPAPADTRKPASDETPSAQDRLELEEIVVTGSRLRRTALQGPQQVDVYTRDEIQSSGQSTVASFLNTRKEFGPGIQGEQGFQAFSETSTVQLRALPFGTTLVLINGRRAPSIALNNGQFFNLNTIPAAAVERIEVLPQGSSAIYGSDALAGVVNVILRKDIQGLPIDVTYGHAEGLDDVTASLAWGNRWDRASFSVVGSYYDRGLLAVKERPLTADTDYRRFGGIDRRVSTCNPGNVTAVSGNLNGLSTPNAAVPAGITGRPSVSDFAATAGQTNRCNNRFDRALTIPTTRSGVLANASFDITSSTRLDTELMYSRTEETSVLAGGILASRVVPASNAFNPFGQDVRINYRIPADALPLQNDYTSEFTRGVLALTGKLPGTWDYDISGWVARDSTDRPFQTDLDSAAVDAALASSDPNRALNPFATGAPASQAVIDGLKLPRDSSDYLGQTTGANALVRGDVFNLWAGAVEMAAGFEHFRDKLSVDTTPVQPTDYSLSRDVNAFFAEFRMPLLKGSRENEPMLALTSAVRHDDYSDFGSATTPQFGLEYRAVPGLLVHASYGEAFRAPALTNVYAARTIAPANSVTVMDPRRGNELVRPTTVTFGGNPGLQPETGETRAAGIVWSGLTDLDLSATWWQINQSDRINSSPGAQTLVDNETLFSDRIQRGPAVGGLPGPIVALDASAANLGELETAGIDLDVKYTMRTAWGDFTPSLGATHVYRYESQFAPTVPVVNNLGKVNTDVWTAKWRGVAGLNWRGSHLSAGVAGRYIGKYLDRLALTNGTVQTLGDFFVWDINARYSIGEALAPASSYWSSTYVAVGATDLFDEGPQFSASSDVGYEPSTYDIRGRYFFATVGLRF